MKTYSSVKVLDKDRESLLNTGRSVLADGVDDMFCVVGILSGLRESRRVHGASRG